jgi:hypothetical protein
MNGQDRNGSPIFSPDHDSSSCSRQPGSQDHVHAAVGCLGENATKHAKRGAVTLDRTIAPLAIEVWCRDFGVAFAWHASGRLSESRPFTTENRLMIALNAASPAPKRICCSRGPNVLPSNATGKSGLAFIEEFDRICVEI